MDAQIKEITDNESETKEPVIKDRKNKLFNAVYYITAFLTPSIFLFLLYNNNRVEANLHFSQFLILAGIFAVVGLVIYIVLKLISKSSEGALLLTVGFWISFWFYRNIFAIVKRIIPNFPSLIFFIIICVCILGVAIIFRYYRPPFKKVQVIFLVISAYLIFLFFFNLIPGVSFNITLCRARAEFIKDPDIDIHPLVRNSFYVDESLPNPEIHWIHMDGMIRLDTIERYFDISYENTRRELIRRDFIIHDSSILPWASTYISLAALLSPSFYDNLLSTLEPLKMKDSGYNTLEAIYQEGLSYGDDISPNYELIKAFVTAGYEINAVSDDSDIFWQHVEHEETEPEFIFGIWHRSMFGELLDLLSIKTPLLIEPTFKRAPNVSNNSSANDSRVPQLTFKIIPHSHASYFYYYAHEDIPTWQEGLTAVHAYPTAYDDALYHMFDYIDSVLERNPGALLILQSDHGLHAEATLLRLLELGYTDEQVLEMMRSVFSAVRIPEMYGGVEVPIHPLNITRVLVNRFVGENYELLPDR